MHEMMEASDKAKLFKWMRIGGHFYVGTFLGLCAGGLAGMLSGIENWLSAGVGVVSGAGLGLLGGFLSSRRHDARAAQLTEHFKHIKEHPEDEVHAENKQLARDFVKRCKKEQWLAKKSEFAFYRWYQEQKEREK
jgi:hypothetical protein